MTNSAPTLSARLEGGDGQRIAVAPASATAMRMSLAHVLAAGDTLMLRYRRSCSGAVADVPSAPSIVCVHDRATTLLGELPVLHEVLVHRVARDQGVEAGFQARLAGLCSSSQALGLSWRTERLWRHAASFALQSFSRRGAGMDSEERRRESLIGIGPGCWGACLLWRWPRVSCATAAHCYHHP